MRAGVLGAGLVARRHVEKLLTLPGVRVAAVTDPQRHRAEDIAERLTEAGLLAVAGYQWRQLDPSTRPGGC